MPRPPRTLQPTDPAAPPPQSPAPPQSLGPAPRGPLRRTFSPEGQATTTAPSIWPGPSVTRRDLALPGLKGVGGHGPPGWLIPSRLTHASLPFSRVTSPMLLVALAVFFGACYILYLRTLQSKFVLFGEKFPVQMVL